MTQSEDSEIATLVARWDEAGKMMMHGMRKESKMRKTQNEGKSEHEPQMSEEQSGNETEVEAKSSEALYSDLEEYFHLAFINRSILRTEPMDTAGLKVALKEFQLVC